MEGDTLREGVLFFFEASAFIGFSGCLMGSMFAWIAYFDAKEGLSEIAYKFENEILREKYDTANIAASTLAIAFQK